MLLATQSVRTKSELENYYLMHGQAVRVFGNLTFGDMASEIWVFDIYSNATPNGTTVIKPLNDVSPMNDGPGRYILFEKMAIPDFNQSLQTTSSGNVVFYLTNDKTSTGVALYNNVTYVNPIVNNSANNYTYQWSYNSITKALTVNVKTNLQQNVLTSLLGAIVPALAPPSNVANGTEVFVLVKGN